MKYFSKILLTGISLFLAHGASAQQKDIARINQMPDKPAPYLMSDWKKVTKDYDSFVFDVTKTGNYLPITTISTNTDGTNYSPLNNMFMSTYVGQDSKTTAEAINILPSLVGASLVGIDKSNQNSVNWVEKAKDFYNKKNGENVYLNNYSTVTGNDWWYELMPNVYFYQLYSLYPNTVSDFSEQFSTVADRQLEVVEKLGGVVFPWTSPNMNYRAFNLQTGLPKEDGVKEPEAAGAIAWILYQAYGKLGDEKYRLGAEMSLDFLNKETNNPSYELQLPYGVQVASRMNAVENTTYDIDKLLNWVFSDGKNTLRNWGTIVGNWNGYDVSGLVGEAKDGGNDYAFIMNGFQHAGALAPVAKYDKRYAKALAKWLLNLSNASRYFYPGALPAANQEATSLAWATTNNIEAIPYESIKETYSGKSPLAMGDALKGGWAPTDLSLYSGSSVGYLGGIVSTTNVEGILQIDLNKTDFGVKTDLLNYLYFNPNTQSENVSLTLPSGTYNIYDAITETDLLTNVSGTVSITIPQKDVRSIVVYPSSTTKKEEGKLLKLENGEILDYHHKWNYTPSLRIKTIYSPKEEVADNEEVTFNVLAENGASISYEWYVGGVKQTETSAKLVLSSPLELGDLVVKCIAKSGSEVAESEKTIKVISSTLVKPEIKEVTLSGGNPYNVGSVIDLKAETNIEDGYVWTSNGGTLEGAGTATPKWTLPTTEGVYTLELKVSNTLGEATWSRDILVKNLSSTEAFTPVIYYPFDGNTNNLAQDKFNAVLEGAVLTTDPNGETDRAYMFEDNKQYMYTPNDQALNFEQQMTLSFWLKPTKLGEGEQYVISHGSWEDRFKVSLAPEKKIIFTLNTTSSIVDIDDPQPLENDVYTHYTFVFTGYSVEVYRKGELVNFRKMSGTIKTTAKDLAIARKDVGTTDYTFKGAMDEVRLYDKALSIEKVKELPTLFQDIVTNDVGIKKLRVNGVEWNINDKYIIDCSYADSKIEVEVETFNGATADKATTSIDVSKPGIISHQFNIKANDGTAQKDYTLKIEKSFNFADIITQKWNNVLTVNNNSATNGGFEFVSYAWSKDGAKIGERQYYSAGNNDETLDANALYSVKMTTKDGEEISVCPFKPIAQQNVSVSVYPNPVSVGEPICVDAQVADALLNSADAKVYSNGGQFVKAVNIQDTKSYFHLNDSGLYILQFQTKDGYKKSFKILVK